MHEEVIRMRRNNLSWKDCAEKLGATRQQLRTWRKANNFQDPFVEISDEDLYDITKEFIFENGRRGVQNLTGHLRSLGIKASRRRQRITSFLVDKDAQILRKSAKVSRVRYVSQGPHWRWHMDGNHKLIHWGIVIHGCIDGFSRKLIFCECSDNNTGKQVKQYFIDAVRREGYPCGIRVDYGVENYATANIQWVFRDLSEGAVLTGSSNHNTRIERMWRDITERFTDFYIDYFSHLVSLGADPDHVLDRWLIHFLFLPRMREDLREFVLAHNHHPISTMKNKSPVQLLEIHSERSYASFDNIEEKILALPYNDFNEASNQWVVDGVVHSLPRLQCPLNDEQLHEFVHTCKPISLCESRELLVRNEESVHDQKTLVYEYLDYRYFAAKKLFVSIFCN